jgi:hypothetical protein
MWANLPALINLKLGVVTYPSRQQRTCTFLTRTLRP